MRCDDLIPAGQGRGIDVALQRADDLDLASLGFIAERCQTTPTAIITALDVASGSGGHAVRMAKAGATVTATDILDRTTDVAALAKANDVADLVSFKPADMLTLTQAFDGPFDVITCQRAIHYLPYLKGLEALAEMKKLLAEGGKLYLSASGIGTELAEGYAAKDYPLAQRFAPLAESVAKHHDILQPVCLYSEEDLRQALETAGFKVEKIYASSFGNIKAVATH